MSTPRTALGALLVLPGNLALFSLRLLAGVAAVGLLSVAFGPQLAEWMLPLLHQTYTFIDRDHRIAELVVSSQGVLRGADQVYRLTVVPTGLAMVGDQVVHTNPQGWAKVSVLTAYLWQPLAVAAALLLAWPAPSARQAAVRWVWLLVLATAFVPLDLPFVLWAQVWVNYQEAYAPGEFSALLLWSQFLQNGGRWVVGMGMFLAVTLWSTHGLWRRSGTPSQCFSEKRSMRAVLKGWP